ncbi:MAG: sugar ABC transporter permease [Oscillospiraceae bacterium]|nr:sugar ABC transporter permease [Oscillospiraceae bacterium]
MQDTMNNPLAAPPKKRSKAKSLDRIKARAGWWFIMPFVIGFFVIYLPVILESIYFSFTKIRILQGGGFNAEFVGWENYSDALFMDPDYVQLLATSLQNLLFEIPAIVIFALFVAILLNQKMAGRAVFRAIFFIPVILGTGIIDRIDQGNNMLSHMENTGRQMAIGASETNTGDSTAVTIVSAMDFRMLFRYMRGLDPALIIYVVDMVNNIYMIVNRAGVQMLIFLGGLQSISPAIYESAYMEGASSWETFWKITFPMISPMILVTAIYTVIDSFTRQSNRIMTFIAAVYDEPDGNVLSSAMAWIYFLIVIAAIAIVGVIVSSFVFYQRRAD